MKGRPLAVIDIRILFAVQSFGESGEWVEGSATINPGPGDMIPGLPGQGDAINKAVVSYLFNERQHTTRMMRLLVGTDDSDLQRGADLQSMQAAVASLTKSIDQHRR